uniref:Uncharacterized protein n=1 Tax=Eutreptiella gymnastica TaxID=73025 RepID=A0A7S4C7N3_9EUGL
MLRRPLPPEGTERGASPRRKCPGAAARCPSSLRGALHSPCPARGPRSHRAQHAARPPRARPGTAILNPPSAARARRAHRVATSAVGRGAPEAVTAFAQATASQTDTALLFCS